MLRNFVNENELQNADCRFFCRHGETVLHYAVLAGKKDIAEMLLELGVDPRGGSGVNGTALDVAKASGQHDIASLLESSHPHLATFKCCSDT